MDQVLVITRSSELAKSLARYFRYTMCTDASVMRPSMESAGPQHLVIHSFQRIASWIESKQDEADGVDIRNTLVFIDLFDPSLLRFEEMDPLALDKGNWSATVAMLSLAFPEIHWVFNTPYNTPENALFQVGHVLGHGNRLSKIIELRDAEYTPLFDASGLRLSLRKVLMSIKESNYVPVRHHVATAIDEEDDYAFFNAYMAYRLGYRCHLVSSYLMMEKILFRPEQAPAGQGSKAAPSAAQNNGNNRETQNGLHDEHIELIFEDMYLNFPDHTDPNLHLSNLKERSLKFRALDDQKLRSQYRAFVTVGHDIGSNRQLVKNNEQYKKDWESRGPRKFSVVLKPVSGFFHLLEESGASRAEDYIWPPTVGDAPLDPEDESLPVDQSARRWFYSGHSAPGRLLEVSERLLYRAQQHSEQVNTVPEAVYRAMLALEAQELLGHRTPTTSLQALALKHKSEVNAECLFYGVGTNKEVKKRFVEIEKEITSIGRWLNPTTRKAAQLDAEMTIVSKLMLVFRQNYQFDEEQECLKKLRNLNRQLWSRKRRRIRRNELKTWKAPLAALGWLGHWVVLFGRAYVERLINSITLFLFAIVGWLFALSILYGWRCNCTEMAHHKAAVIENPALGLQSTEIAFVQGSPLLQKVIFYFEQGVMHALTAFFGLQPPHDVDQLEQFGLFVFILTVAAIGLGFVHLGIFVSHVYSVISRR